MELLIPGLLLVALMVYLSTRIKKSAAAAFEREEVETPEFSLVKPEGFINPVNNPPEVVFSAYSKDFGTDAAENLRQAEIIVTRLDGAAFDLACEAARGALASVTSEDTKTVGGHRACEIRGSLDEQGVPTAVSYSILEGDGVIFELRAVVIEDHKETYAQRIDETLSTFILK